MPLWAVINKAEIISEKIGHVVGIPAANNPNPRLTEAQRPRSNIDPGPEAGTALSVASANPYIIPFDIAIITKNDTAYFSNNDDFLIMHPWQKPQYPTNYE